MLYQSILRLALTALVLLAATALAQSQLASQPVARSPCPRAIKINTSPHYRDSLHFICLQAAFPRPRLEVIQYFPRQVILSRDVDEAGIDLMTSFVDDEGALRILVSVPVRINGTSMYSIDSNGNFIDETHTLNTQLVSAMSIWKLNLNHEWQLAISNQPSYGAYVHDMALATRTKIPELKPIISIHSWRATYFDSYQRIELAQDGKINKLEPMLIGDMEFLIVAMESKQVEPGVGFRQRSPITPVHSQIFRLDFGDGSLNWLPYQPLQTKVALDVRSFIVTHKNSLQRDHFIAVLGQMDYNQAHSYFGPRNNQSELASHGLIIFKFLGDQFVRTHHIPAPTVTKLDAITYGVGDSYVVIALLSEFTRQVTLYRFDGLSLHPLTVPIGPPRVSRPYDGRVQQRTLDSSPGGMHLFMIPPSSSPQHSDSSDPSKRTLNAEQGAEPMVALSLSDPSEIGLPEANASSSVYVVPTDVDITTAGGADGAPATGEDQSHRKRSFVGNELLSWCNRTINSILLDDFVMSSRKLTELPRVDQNRPIELNGNLIIEDNLHVTNLLYTERILERREVTNYELPPIGAVNNFSDTFDQIQATNNEINSVKRQVDAILVDDGTTQEVFTPLTFETLVLDCATTPTYMDPRLKQAMGLSCPHVDEIRTDFLNGRDISNITRQALITGRSMTIKSEVRFEHLVLHGKVKILGTLNGIPIADIVFGRGPLAGQINGHKNFRNGLFSNARLNVANWNGFGVNRTNYLTSSGHQRIESPLRFSQLILDPARPVRPSPRIEYLNGLHLDTHLFQIATSELDNKFDTQLQFDELIINGDVHFKEGAYLSSINLEHLWNNIMFKHSHQNISWPFELVSDVHMSYGGDIIVDGPINGLPFAAGQLLMRDQSYTLPNPMIFEHDVGVRNLQLEKALNGIQVAVNNGHKELAILYDGGSQIISSDKVLGEVVLGGTSFISGNINGNLNLTQLYNLAVDYAGPHRFTNIKLAAPDIRVADTAQITIASTINGIQVNDLCSFANRLASSQVQHAQYNRLKFEQTVEFRSLRCASINGFNNLTNSFLTRHGNQRVAGTLRLSNGVILNTTVNVLSKLNNLSAAPMNAAISRAVSESRTGQRDVYGDLWLDELQANRINDLRMEDVFMARSDYPQLIRAPMVFDHLDIESVLVIRQNLITNLFNNLNVTDLFTNTLQYDATQIIYNHVQLNTLQLLAGSNLITKSLNGHNIRALFDDAVLVDIPQQVLAPKTFRGPSDELIDDDLEFNSDVVIKKDLEIQSGIINDIDVSMFVDNILYEDRSNQRGMRVLGNGSIRFHDIKLNNLVIAGTIQGLDLSREAVLRADNVNGTFDPRISEQRALLNNQRLLRPFRESGSGFRVQSTYRGQTIMGDCKVHSCLQTTPLPGRNQMTMVQPMPTPRPQFAGRGVTSLLLPGPAPNTSRPLPPPPPPFVPRQPQYDDRARTNYIKQLIPVQQPQPMRSFNQSLGVPLWRSPLDTGRPMDLFNLVDRTQPNYQNDTRLIDPKFIEHRHMIQAQAIRDLTSRVNRFLSTSFYYEILQKHPLLGPLLHATNNPILNEVSGSLLLLKATSKLGEPCLQRGQTIAIMTRQRRRGSPETFSLSSRLPDTSNPIAVASLAIGRAHYLFVLDTNFEGAPEHMSQIMVYFWDYQSGMYELKEKIMEHGTPTAMKAFRVNDIGCLALATPRVLHGSSNGAPTIYCQQSPNSPLFNERVFMPLSNVFDLDVMTIPGTYQVIVAALSQQDTEQIGDLSVHSFDVLNKSLHSIALRRTVRPLKLHLFRNRLRPLPIQLAVSEGITSSDGVQAITRVFSLRITPSGSYSFYESQVIRDNQFYDIQSVSLDNEHSMLFMQSSHSISVYAPKLPATGLPVNQTSECDPNYALVQRLPTKGANKFLVFNDHNLANSQPPFGHSLVLSKDDCEQQQFSTIILRAKFRVRGNAAAHI